MKEQDMIKYMKTISLWSLFLLGLERETLILKTKNKMKQRNYWMGLLLVSLILIVMCSSCSTYGKSCEGNRKMLTTASGYTKFRK
jgi:hypothetical protein